MLLQNPPKLSARKDDEYVDRLFDELLQYPPKLSARKEPSSITSQKRSPSNSENLLERDGEEILSFYEGIINKHKLTEAAVLKVLTTYVACGRNYHAMGMVFHFMDFGYSTEETIKIYGKAGLRLDFSGESNEVLEQQVLSGISFVLGEPLAKSHSRAPWLRRLLEEMHLQPSQDLLERLLEHHSFGGYYEEAVELFKQLESPETLAYDSYIRALIGLKDYKKVAEVLRHMEGRNMKVQNSTIQTLFESYAADGDYNKAVKMFEMMQRTSSFVKDMHYESLMMLCGNVGNINHAKELYSSLKSANKVTESLIVTMINVARMARDRKLEEKLWAEKIQLTDTKHSSLTHDEEVKRSDVVKLVHQKCFQIFGMSPTFPCRETITNNTKKLFVVHVQVGDIVLALAEGKSKARAIMQGAFRALERLSDYTHK